VVTRAQLLEIGATKEMVTHRIAIRRLHRVHPGVYGVGHRLSVRGHYLSAVYACGAGAVLSHGSAAALWELRGPPAGRIDVTLPRRGARSRARIQVHRTRVLGPGDIAERDGIPCTSVARTLVDLAEAAPEHRLRRALERSVELRLFDGRALGAVMDRLNGRCGLATLRQLIAELPDEPPVMRSELERRFLELVRRAGLPLPAVNARVASHEVDFNWPAHRLIVETDGRRTHATGVAFERDRARDLDLRLAGWQVVRLTWSQVVRTPDRVTEVLRALLAGG
jgi:very-short-patch-repair endonuclease